MRERRVVEFALAGALLVIEACLGRASLATSGRGLAGRWLEALDLRLEGLGRDARVRQAPRDVLELARGLAPLAIDLRERHARLGEAIDHIAALLLEQAHVALEAAEDVAAATALLAEVSDEEALLLEQTLELLELAALLVRAELRELDGGRGLLGARLELGPLTLETPHVVDGELAGEL